MENEKDTVHAEEDSYRPRPKWQVWGARIVLAVFIAFLLIYYRNFFIGGL